VSFSAQVVLRLGVGVTPLRLPSFRPGEAVLIDDNLPNVEGVHAFGMKAVHHRSAEGTIAALRALGLPA
jgi:2-haloacid dehalogenase